jgi:hypothetical protein
MRTTIRRSARLLGIAAMAVLLSGCLKLDQALTLNEDDTVDGEVVFAFDKGLLEMSGASADDFMEQTTEGEGPLPEGVEFETEPYEDDDYVGQKFTFEGAPLSAFSEAEGSDLSITREGDTFVVTGALDASSEDLDPTGTPGAEEILGSFDVRIAITFPGEVEEATGEIDGNTVTWTPELGETTEISARGSAVASGGGGGSAVTWIVIPAVLLLLGGIVVLAVVLGRKKPSATEGAEPAEPIAAPPVAGEEPIAAQEAPTVAQEAPTPPSEVPPPPPAPVTEPVPSPEPTVDLPGPGATETDPAGDAGTDGDGSD